MTVDEVRAWVVKIAAKKSDIEEAHGEEDMLYREVLRHVADGNYGDATEMAKEALKTRDIIDERWYA